MKLPIGCQCFRGVQNHDCYEFCRTFDRKVNGFRPPQLDMKIVFLSSSASVSVGRQEEDRAKLLRRFETGS